MSFPLLRAGFGSCELVLLQPSDIMVFCCPQVRRFSILQKIFSTKTGELLPNGELNRLVIKKKNRYVNRCVCLACMRSLVPSATGLGCALRETTCCADNELRCRNIINGMYQQKTKAPPAT